MAWGAYPPYLEKRPRDRLIAVWDCRPTSMMVTEDGELRDASSWEALVASLCQDDLGVDLHCQSMTTFPYVDEAVADRRAKVGCNQESEVGGIEVRIGRRRMWIGSLQSWGMKVATVAAAIEIRAFCDYMAEGTRQSPAAVGQSAMRRLIEKPDGGWRRKVPCWQLRQMLDKGGIGGRADTWASPGDYFPEAYEVDMDDAYLWGIQHVPDGTPTLLRHSDRLLCDDHISFSESASHMDTWFGQAVICIPSENKIDRIGPFPWRDGLQVTFPIAPGWYGHEESRPLFMFKEEIEDCFKAGMLVWLIGPQWGWTRTTSCLRPWAEHMTRKRREAPEELAPLCKLSIVAGIGWHGQKPQQRQVVPLEESSPESVTDPERICTIGGGSTPRLYSVVTRRRESMPYMTHWYWHDQMNVRRQLRHEVQRQLRLGNQVLSTNFDSILIVTRSKATLGMLSVHTRLPDRPRSWRDGPHWKVGKLTKVTIPYARAIISEEKVRLPGRVQPASTKSD